MCPTPPQSNISHLFIVFICFGVLARVCRLTPAAHLFELWPRFPPAPECFSSVSVLEFEKKVWVPSDTRPCRSAPRAFRSSVWPVGWIRPWTAPEKKLEIPEQQLPPPPPCSLEPSTAPSRSGQPDSPPLPQTRPASPPVSRRSGWPRVQGSRSCWCDWSEEQPSGRVGKKCPLDLDNPTPPCVAKARQVQRSVIRWHYNASG